MKLGPQVPFCTCKSPQFFTSCPESFSQQRVAPQRAQTPAPWQAIDFDYDVFLPTGNRSRFIGLDKV